MEQKINVLGTEYTIYLQSEDARLAECDGFCDKTTKEIHIGKFPDDCDLGQPAVYEKKILRHELVHAFMFESGLAEGWEHQDYGQEELTVDWFAYMAPKLFEAFKAADCI